jgi:hypothetical protein
MAIAVPDIQHLGSVKRGDTWNISITWLQSLGGNPVDLANSTSRMQIRDKRHILLAEADSCEADILTGTVYATFLPDTTADVPPGLYYTDQEVTFSIDDVKSSPTVTLLVLQDQTYD